MIGPSIMKIDLEIMTIELNNMHKLTIDLKIMQKESTDFKIFWIFEKKLDIKTIIQELMI